MNDNNEIFIDKYLLTEIRFSDNYRKPMIHAKYTGPQYVQDTGLVVVDKRLDDHSR
jgi:hypothetical protein